MYHAKKRYMFLKLLLYYKGFLPGFLKTPKKTTIFPWWLVVMWLATGGWVADRWLVASHRSPVTSHQEFSHQVTSHQNGWWLVAGGWGLVAGGWWLVAGGWWLVASGWWLVVGGWWLVSSLL